MLKNKQDIAYHYEVDRTLANFGIKVVGVLVNFEDLPGSTSEYPLPLAPDYTGEFGDAYAVGQPGDYTYYIYTRANPDLGYTENFWLDAGKLAIDADLGTIVTVDGEKQSTWDADTKVNKITVNNGKIAYAALSNGEQGQVSISINNYTAYPNTGKNTDGAVAGYVNDNWGVEKPDGNGVLLSNNPTKPYQVATKKYIDDNAVTKNSPNIGAGNMQRLFGMKSDGTVGWYYAAGAAGMGFYTYFIPCYMPINHIPTAQHEAQLDASVLFTGSPIHPYQCANKKYVDDKTGLYKTTIRIEDSGEVYTIYANTHKPINESDITLYDIATLLSESGEDYSGINTFLFEHLKTENALLFIAQIYDNTEDDGTFSFALITGSTAQFLSINGDANCTASSIKV